MSNMPRFRPPLGPPAATPQQQVVALWRRTDLAPLEKSQTNAARPLGQVMTGVLQQLGLE